eukprot:9306841-Pyramimonas_sp.AAC.1
MPISHISFRRLPTSRLERSCLLPLFFRERAEARATSTLARASSPASAGRLGAAPACSTARGGPSTGH